MKYQNLLFDVDDTLLDFHAAENQALKALFAEIKYPLTDDMVTYFRALNEHMWQRFELGQLDRQTLVNTRFTKLFAHFNETVDGIKYEQIYREFLNQGHQLEPHALELLNSLKDQFNLFIVSNGIGSVQQHRLNDSGLSTYFKHIFVSEEVGYQKPRIEFFDFIANHISGFTPKNALIIGDSLTSDIQGGANAGIDSVWFNPALQPNHSSVSPTYQIDDLLDLKEIL
ncbi:5'-nucleotidase YjjG [Pediococcus damnosus]|uniref:5'-nucleotidase YjjG n=1 Tax=Pediococcus damnosus TaxID=51663 RepID=A0A0R2HA34_9LACO|nr:YjjG family noncanonical pyrimidine nucleotidase [Pediococcus damnosus]AMV60792.1 5'-nucleotidase YjjG [Pediococcus damnosus]AMV63380.1 5'-nucleotidase YjjG [Pediococcus damnosus]AMV65103.1 5'-nucleotidase YjjG [Pediococcus damnosus]AMV66715.1 5'-nucleotidase YjjG [Pediococcus damnosus]AMV69917.1 5'-nucleotidase YjjG [Pediococcus damnosus]